MIPPKLDESELQELVRLCRENPDVVVTLPEELYTNNGRSLAVRVEIDGIRWVLHRWLYDQLHDEPLGRDALRRVPEVDPLNVNPFLFSRIATSDRERCPNGHLYAEVGEVTGHPETRCARCYEDRLARRRVGGLSKAELNRQKTHCDHGHEFTPENTLYRKSDGGARRCAQCELDRSRRRSRPQPNGRELR